MKRKTLLFTCLLLLFSVCLISCSMGEEEEEIHIPDIGFELKCPVFEKDKVLEVVPLLPSPNGCEAIYIIPKEPNFGTFFINSYFEDEFISKDSFGKYEKGRTYKETVALSQTPIYKYEEKTGALTFKLNGGDYKQHFILNESNECCMIQGFYLYKIGTSLFNGFDTVDKKYNLWLREDGTGDFTESGTRRNLVYENNGGIIYIQLEDGRSFRLKFYKGSNVSFLISTEQDALLPCKVVDEITVAAKIRVSTSSKYDGFDKIPFATALSSFPNEIKKNIIICGISEAEEIAGYDVSDDISFHKEKRNIHIKLDEYYKNFKGYNASAGLNKDKGYPGVVSFTYCDGKADNYKIQKNAFANYSNMKEIYISGACNKIEKDAFVGCDSLEKVVFEKTDGWVIPGQNGEEDIPASISVDAAANVAVIKALTEGQVLVRKTQEAN